jgi:hypothetical protein
LTEEEGTDVDETPMDEDVNLDEYDLHDEFM